MASELVSFMMVFGLGISMVVGITLTMQSLSDGIFDTSARVSLDDTLDQIKGTITDGINSINQWIGVSPTYQHNLDLYRLLVNKYAYEISVVVISGTYYIVGKTINSQTNITESFSLIFNVKDVSISGTISSTSSNPYVLFTKVSNGIVVILGNT